MTNTAEDRVAGNVRYEGARQGTDIVFYERCIVIGNACMSPLDALAAVHGWLFLAKIKEWKLVNDEGEEVNIPALVRDMVENVL